MRKDADGRIRLKIVLVGPSLAGKTTTLKWLHGHLPGVVKGGFTAIQDPSGRTLFFDYSPFFITKNLRFDIYTVAGQERHKNQRSAILKEADGIMFVADSSSTMMEQNVQAVKELREELQKQKLLDLPVVVCLNKRDVIDALPRQEMMNSLGFGNVKYIETIATKGIGLKRAFQTLTREVLIRSLS